MALVGIELETLVSEPDALTTRPLSDFATNLRIYYVFWMLKSFLLKRF